MASNCLFYRKRKLLWGSCIIFMLVHLYKFTNYLPNWDSMYGMKMEYLGMAQFGRWFSGIAEILTSSPYDLPWVSGIASSFFFGLTMVIILDLFSITEKSFTTVVVLLFAAFPCMAATQNYSLWASAYMLGLFGAVLGVYICVRHGKYFYLSIPCFALSMGIYQIYILFAGAVFVYYIAILMLNYEDKMTKYKMLIITTGIAFVFGGIVYFITDKVSRAISGVELTSYQGISSAGKMSLNTVALGILHMTKTSILFFLKGGRQFSFYSILNISIALLTVVLVMWKIVFNCRFSGLRRVLLCIMLVSVIPITYSFYLVSEGITYHKLMELGDYLIYLIPILIFKNCSFKFDTKIISAMIVILLGSLGIYHFVNDNIGYHQLNMSYERTCYQMTETLLKVDSVNENDYQKIAVFGNFPSLSDGIRTMPDLTGADSNSFISAQYHFTQFAKYYMNREFVQATDEERAAIQATSEYLEMVEYPHGDYVSIIDDIIVVKLSK